MTLDAAHPTVRRVCDFIGRHCRNGKEIVLLRIENALMALLVTLALAMVTVEVVLRYFFPRYLTDYGLELTVYFTVWAIFIAGAPLIREGRHVRADILMHMLPPGAQRILGTASSWA